jgi:hypothetical protein
MPIRPTAAKAVARRLLHAASIPADDDTLALILASIIIVEVERDEAEVDAELAQQRRALRLIREGGA